MIWGECVSGVKYGDLPSDVNQIIRWLVLDTDIAPGHRDHPLTQDEHEQKFPACAELAGSRISDARGGEVVELVDGLEDVADVGVLVGLLSGA